MPGKLCRWVLAWAGLVVLTGIVTAAEPPLLLAETYRKQVDVAQFLVSEKLDGVRAYWDGKQLISRSGNVYNAPAWFVAALPARKLDGELWLGRGRFEEMSGIARREVPLDADWKQVRYMLFELPGGEGTFAQRVSRLDGIIAQANVPWLQAVAQFRLADHKALMKRLGEVVKAGGEGLMLHRAEALYQAGRSETLLKVKQWHDAEATVVAHLPGKGKHFGRLGALKVRAADGREFALGTGFTDAQRLAPPPVGTIVSYRYRELTARGMPRFASFWRVRDGY
jgi:DNA ligase-1